MLKTILAAGAVTLALSGTASAVPIFFDDFESYALGTPASLSPTWTVAPGTIDVIGAGNGFNWWGPGQYIDLNGTPNSPATVTASLSGLNIGSMYNLVFNYGYNRNSGPDEVLTFGVVGGATGMLGPTAFQVLGSTFGSAMLTFQATAASMSIFFADSDNGSGDRDLGGPILDNVSVAAVPLPAAGLLLLAGLGGLAALGRRRASTLAA